MSLRPNERSEARRSRYKVAVDAEKGRRRREDILVEIRKTKREESLFKKRRQGHHFHHPDSQLQNKLESLPALVAGAWSNDPNLQFEAIAQFRKLLSLEQNSPIEEVIQSGVVPRFVEFLARDDCSQLQFEAAWALTNIASGTSDNTKALIDHGAIPIFVRLLSSPNDEVREQAVWALGNFAGDSPKCRDLVLNFGALAPLLAQFNEHARPSMLRNSTWTLSNLCRGKPQPPFEQAVIDSGIFSPLLNLLRNAEFDIKKEAAWVVSNATSGGTHEQIKFLVAQGCIQPLCDILICPDPKIVTVCLEGLENILKVGEAEKCLGITGDVNVYAQMIDDAEGLEKIESLQNHDNNEIYEKAVKILETYWLEDEVEFPSIGAVQSGFNFGGELPVPSGGFNFNSVSSFT